MALPPERINIKRRRQDEPVETLILEESRAAGGKRRFTEFFFQRLRNDQVFAAERGVLPVKKAEPTAIADHGTVGIPLVRPSIPGDEKRDFLAYKEHQKKKQQEHESLDHKTEPCGISLKATVKPTNLSARIAKTARRFHLTRDLSTKLRPAPSGGIRRRKLNIRPPLATFVERHMAHSEIDGSSKYGKPPVDSILHMDDKHLATIKAEDKLPDAVASARVPLKTFARPPTKLGRTSHSIHDDPSTWDLESDQLADELAKFAMEVDPGLAAEVEDSAQEMQPEVVESISNHNIADEEDDYVFETYVRLQHGAATSESSTLSHEYGVLVIDEEDEELWGKYVQDSDDDDDWDEEDVDSNAEDNPRNDYPEDEVSSDDERGWNVYKYRRNTSDDEEFGYDRSS